MKSIWHGVLLSFSYFSILPIRLKNRAMNRKVYASLLLTFPFVGFSIAFLSVLLFMVLKDFMPLGYCAILCACVYLCLYGFLHLEALCDVIDGYFASLSGKNIYEIMKDPHVGAVGAIGTFVFVLMKVAVIAFLLIESKEEIFLTAVIFSRLGLIFGLFAFSFHEKSTFALQLKSSASVQLVLLSFIAYGILSYFVLDFKSVLLFALISIATISWILYVLKKKFGFLNGDCLGASLEKTEFILLNVGLML
jgi:adenosylcobinamide-GDP ribazoletransferase